MKHDEPLNRTPVFQNLDYLWSWYGLALSDLPFVLFPGILLLGFSVLFDISTSWALAAVAAAATGVALLKWRKPESYIANMLHLALAPRRLSHKEPDTTLRQFPLPPSTRGKP